MTLSVVSLFNLDTDKSEFFNYLKDLWELVKSFSTGIWTMNLLHYIKILCYNVDIFC